MHALCLIFAGLVTGSLKVATPGHTVLVEACLYSVFDFLPCGRPLNKENRHTQLASSEKVISGPETFDLGDVELPLINRISIGLAQSLS